MDRELTRNEILELLGQPYDWVRGLLLQDLASELGQLSEKTLLLPAALHNSIKIKDARTIAESLHPDRMEPDDFVFWKTLEGVHSRPPQEPVSGLQSTDVELWTVLEVPQNMVAVFEGTGFKPDDYLKCFGTELMSAKNLWNWIFSQIPIGSIRSWVMAGVPDPETAIEWMRVPYPTPELAMINYRYFGGDLARAKAWRPQATIEAESGPEFPPLRGGRTVEPVRYRTPVTPIVLFPSASSEWLEEIVARARTTQPSLRKVPHWPARIEFEDQNLTIQLEQFSQAIKGVVKVGSERRWCEFNASTFHITSRCENGEDRYVIGMSICWFIDCSITISRMSKGSMRLFTATTTSNSKNQGKQVRYIPTPTFSDRKRDARSLDSRLTIRHKVSGHLRRLPPGQSGSKSARSNAPGHIKRKMSQSETYVEPHFRGTDAEKAELFTRLSHYSALGDAMSELDWS